MKLQGHAAGGFLATRALLHWPKPASASDRAGELALGTLAGILPDLDYIYYATQIPFHPVVLTEEPTDANRRHPPGQPGYRRM